MSKDITKTQKLNLSPYASFDTKDLRILLQVFAYGVVLMSIIVFGTALIIHSGTAFFIYGKFLSSEFLDFDYFMQPGFIIPILAFAVAPTFLFYPKFAKKPMPASIEYDLVNKKILIHHSNAKLFPPKIIRFDEIEEINYSCIGTYKGCVTVAIDFKTFDNRNFSLRSFGYNGSHVKFIAPLEALKEQEGFKTELKNFPTQFFSWIEKYKREGKLSLFLEMGF